MSRLKKAHILIFTGSGVFAGGIVSVIESGPWWLTALLFGGGAAMQAAGMWQHWQRSRGR